MKTEPMSDQNHELYWVALLIMLFFMAGIAYQAWMMPVRQRLGYSAL